MKTTFPHHYNYMKPSPIFSGLIFAVAIFLIPATSFADITVGAPYLYGPMAYYSRTDCPANSFMDGLKRHQQSGDTENTQIVCQNYDPAKIIATGSAYTFGDMNRSHQDNCPAGSYMAGINRQPSDDLDKTQIVCQNYDTGRSAINASGAPYLYGPMTYYDIETDCPAGSYMAGINRTHDGDWEKWQVVCQNYVLSTGAIQGFKVKMPGNDTNAVPPVQETVFLDGGSPTTANSYFFQNVTAGNHAVSVSVPSGWNVGYTLCYNSTGCHGNAPTPGNSISVNVPTGGYADLWWHYSLSTGTVKIKATKDGQPWDSPPLFVDVTMPVGRMNVTTDPPDELRDVPAGTYAVHNVTAPSGAGVTLVDFLPGTAMQNLTAGGTITFTFNFKTNSPATGTVKIKATKDGLPWDSPPFKVNSSIPGSTGDIEIDPAIPSQDIAGASPGTYTANNIPPNQQALAGVAFQNVNGSSLPYGQNLSGGGTITFIFNFTSIVNLPPAVPTLVVAPTSASVQVGGTQQFNAIYDPDGSGPQSPQTVTSSASWSSSNNSVVTVNSIGSAMGASAGSATITANYSGLTASAILTVTGLPPPPSPSPSIGTIQIRATKNGQPWDSPLLTVNGVNPSGPFSGTNLDPPRDLTAMTPGTYTFTFVGFFPSIGVEFQNTTPSATQVLNPGETIAFTFNFTTPAVPEIPNTPSSLRVDSTSLNTCGAIRLIWTDNATNENHFELERDSGPGFVNITNPIANATSFIDTTIAQNVSYTYRVRACNSFGCSAYSNTVTDNNQSPSANFSWSPQTPAVNQPTLFTDTSTVFGGATIVQRRWTFQNGNPAAVTSSQSATTTRFVNVTPVQKSVVLHVTDSLSRACSITKSVTVSQGTPGDWCELPPDSPPGTPCP